MAQKSFLFHTSSLMILKARLEKDRWLNVAETYALHMLTDKPN